MGQIQAGGSGDPSEAAGGDSGDAEGNFVVGAEFLFAVEEELDECAVDVSEAKEAEVVGMNADFLARGLKPHKR